MARLTITLSDEKHRVLKQAAARRGTTIGAIIEESLEHAGVKSEEDALAILERAWRNAAETMGDMTEEQVTDWAVDEVRDYRRERQERMNDATADAH
jgi:predicted transcriptional regulator